MNQDHQDIFDVVKSELPNVVLAELDYGFTLVLHNPDTDRTAYLARCLRGPFQGSYFCNPTMLIYYLQGGDIRPYEEDLLRVYLRTPEEVQAIFKDTIERMIDRRVKPTP